MTAFLASRGLELSAAKTRIVHIDDGFDFLGFNIRRFSNGKLLVRPQKEKLRDFGPPEIPVRFKGMASSALNG